MCPVIDYSVDSDFLLRCQTMHQSSVSQWLARILIRKWFIHHRWVITGLSLRFVFERRAIWSRWRRVLSLQSESSNYYDRLPLCAHQVAEMSTVRDCPSWWCDTSEWHRSFVHGAKKNLTSKRNPTRRKRRGAQISICRGDHRRQLMVASHTRKTTHKTTNDRT